MWQFMRIVLMGMGLCAGSVFVQAEWRQSRVLPAAEAKQAVAAEGQYVYAIDNKVIVRYDRRTGDRIAVSRGEAEHLNSGFIWSGKLYSAHSNYPQKPERSEIKELDLKTMEMSVFHSFGESPRGSLTVAVRENNVWWCVFAHYGLENHRTVLVRYDADWREQGTWSFPASVVSDLGSFSISGGVWRDGKFLATGHDKPVIYVLALPDTGTVLEHQKTVQTPFPGQGIAVDPVTHGLLGIHRARRQIVFAEEATPVEP